MNFFNSWESILRILGTGFFGYFVLIIMLRVTGNRTLSQMNSFDFIVTIAMGSTLSSGILQKSVAFLDMTAALFLLIALQYILTKLSVNSASINSLIKSKPTLVFYQSEFLDREMKKARVNKDEIFAAMRQGGLSTVDQVEAVILETNGTITAIPKKISSNQSLEDPKTYDEKSMH